LNENYLVIEGAFNRRNNQVYLDFTFSNNNDISISQIFFKFNKNAYKLSASTNSYEINIDKGGKEDYSLLCENNSDFDQNFRDSIQVGLKIDPGLGIYVVNVPINQNVFDENEVKIIETKETEEINEKRVKEITGGVNEEQLIVI